MGVDLLAAVSRGDIFLAPALWGVFLVVLGWQGPGVLASQCCCFLSKEIPQEIPQQPTNWSRWALEARALSER